MKVLVWIEVKLIRFYQIFLSFDHGLPHKIFPFMSVCMFEPTCSEYTLQAVKRFGIFKGNYLGAKRIIKCGPWSAGKSSYDPVPDPGLTDK